MPCLLLVEGRDDAFVFRNLLDHYYIGNQVVQGKLSNDDVISILNEDGISKLLTNLPQRLRATNVPRLGIVVEADINITSRWNELRNILLAAGYSAQNVPPTPDPNGTLIQQPGMDVPTVGIWLMPDNRVPGMLEHFVEFLVPANDTLWGHATTIVSQLPEVRFAGIHTMKAYVHTWLAWQKEPGPPMGLAITMKYLDAQAPIAQQLVQWIRSVFGV